MRAPDEGCPACAPRTRPRRFGTCSVRGPSPQFCVAPLSGPAFPEYIISSPVLLPSEKVRGNRRNKRSCSTLLQGMWHCQRATRSACGQRMIGDALLHGRAAPRSPGAMRINSVIGFTGGTSGSAQVRVIVRPLDRHERPGARPRDHKQERPISGAGAYDFVVLPARHALPRVANRRRAALCSPVRKLLQPRSRTSPLAAEPPPSTRHRTSLARRRRPPPAAHVRRPLAAIHHPALPRSKRRQSHRPRRLVARQPRGLTALTAGPLHFVHAASAFVRSVLDCVRCRLLRTPTRHRCHSD